MEELTVEEVKNALATWLGSGSVVDLDVDSDSRITGWIMHPHFRGVSRAERQAWLWSGFPQNGMLPQWKGLRGEFAERATKIGVILTYSPEEYENALGVKLSA